MFNETSPKRLALIATLQAKPGKGGALADAVAAIVPAVLGEPGCIEYRMHVAQDDSASIVMYETWRDKAALDLHGKAPAFRSLAAQFDELLEGEPIVRLLDRRA